MQRDELGSMPSDHPIICARVCLESVLGAVGAHLKGDMLLYQGDNQAAIHCLRSMKGRGSILPVVKQIHDLARRYDVMYI
jgi:hypothetical protein